MNSLREIAKAMYDNAVPPRAYHNWRHVEACLAELDIEREQCANDRLVEIALWFHDAIYDPRRNDNEERSADAACRAMQAESATTEQIATVRQLILDTKHVAEPLTGDGRIMADIDLLILAARPMAFAEYERAIRQEYAFLSDADFARGRADVLRRFLERPYIYWTKRFRNGHEWRARQNLAIAIKRWTA